IVTFAEDGTKTRIERISYEYGENGIRTSALHEIDADADGNFETQKETIYLNDPLNITGYSQVLYSSHLIIRYSFFDKIHRFNRINRIGRIFK
ncbi:MAG: hypothetical protein LBC20_13430, partial [Planctomycetaceae bacterium]|nr:hypothetical protein [Planctomycetaceae bacterium]